MSGTDGIAGAGAAGLAPEIDRLRAENRELQLHGAHLAQINAAERWESRIGRLTHATWIPGIHLTCICTALFTFTVSPSVSSFIAVLP